MFKKLPAHLSTFHVIIKRKKRKQEDKDMETRLPRFYIMLHFFFYFMSILYALTCLIIDALLINEINFSLGFI